MDTNIKDNSAFAINLIKKGKSFIITGKAGTGKTTLINIICSKLEGEKNIAKLAFTGIAANNAKGVTIHSFLRLPISPYRPDYQNKGLYRASNDIIETIKHTDIIIIDEISMVRCDLLDEMDDVLRHYRKNDEPFGGIQIVMAGDLYQLAPVCDDDWDKISEYYESPYFFSSRVMQKMNYPMYELLKVRRQEGDPEFIEILNKIRDGNMPDKDLMNLLLERYDPYIKYKPERGYTYLTTHRRKADDFNSEQRGKIRAWSYSYKAKIKGEVYRNNYPTDETLTLKEGARVMFVRNDNKCKRYFNGTLGVITRLDRYSIYVKPDNGFEIKVEKEKWDFYKYVLDEETKTLKTVPVGSFIQYPLKMAWAITIHKCQGLTLDKAMIDLEDTFAPGQIYVALSRCRSLQGIKLVSEIPMKKIVSDPIVAEYMKKAEPYPVNDDIEEDEASTKVNRIIIGKPEPIKSPAKLPHIPACEKMELHTNKGMVVIAISESYFSRLYDSKKNAFVCKNAKIQFEECDVVLPDKCFERPFNFKLIGAEVDIFNEEVEQAMKDEE